MQVRKQQLEPYMEQQIGSKSGKEYVKAVYCHPAYLTCFCIVNKAEIDVFLELSCFFHDLADVANLISGSSAFSKTSIIDYAKVFHCVDHNKLWKILNEMGIPDHLTCLLRNL